MKEKQIGNLIRNGVTTNKKLETNEVKIINCSKGLEVFVKTDVYIIVQNQKQF